MSTPLERIEELVEILSDRAVEVIERTVEHITIEGRPFGAVTKSLEIQHEDYMKVRGNREAYIKHIDSKARALIDQLMEDGIAEEDIVSIHPYNIAVRFTIDWSYQMENEIKDHPELMEATV